jgi:hypothetical protein
MFRTAILRSAVAASRVVARPVAARSAVFILPKSAVAFAPAQRLAAIRMYSAGGVKSKKEVEDRIMGILNGFDKVSSSPLRLWKPFELRWFRAWEITASGSHIEMDARHAMLRAEVANMLAHAGETTSHNRDKEPMLTLSSTGQRPQQRTIFLTAVMPS